MTEEITKDQAQRFLDTYVADQVHMLNQVMAQAECSRQAAMLEKKLVVFAMSGAFVNELSLTYSPNGLWYNVRIT